MADQPAAPPKKFLSDHAGKPSSMRLLSLLSFLMASTLALIGAFQFGAGTPNQELTLYFLLGAFAPKAVQSFAEHQSK